MTETDKVTRFVKLCEKLAKEDLRHPERQPDFRTAIELLGEVIDQQQAAMKKLESRIRELEE
jgi:hypothetical protein